MWWVMAESCLPCLCSSCACSTRYHFVPPSLATCNKPFCISLGAHNAASSPGFRCQGNRHPRRHPMTAQGEGGGMGGRVGDVALALSVLQGAPDLWPFPNTLPLQWHTQTKHTKQQYVYTHRKTHMNAPKHTSKSKRKKWTESKRERKGFQTSELSSESVCVWLIEVIYVQSPVTPCMVHDFITL